ncbi:hypothetical protein S83_032849 [Arachis hypogaea]
MYSRFCENAWRCYLIWFELLYTKCLSLCLEELLIQFWLSQQPLTTQQPPPRRVRIQDWKDVAVKILKRDNLCEGGFDAGAVDIIQRSAEQSRGDPTALQTRTCSSSGAPSVSRRNTLSLAPGWNDVVAAKIGEALINVPRSRWRRWECRGILKRSTAVACCPHVVDGGVVSNEGGDEVDPMLLVLWRAVDGFECLLR